MQCMLYELKQPRPEASVPELRVLSNNLIQLLKRYCEAHGKAQLALDYAESYLILQYQSPEEFRPLLDALCERFRLAMATSAAKVTMSGSQPPEKEAVDRLLEQVEMERF